MVRPFRPQGILCGHPSGGRAPYAIALFMRVGNPAAARGRAATFAVVGHDRVAAT